MANADGSAVTKQQINELMAAIGQKLSNLSAEEIGRLHGKKEAFAEQCGTVATKLAEVEPIAPPAHETIRIPCTIGDRMYMACGFLKAGESSVKGQTMLDRTQVDGTTAIDDAEWTHLLEYHKDFKKFSELDQYYLATERRNPGFPQRLSCLHRYSEERYEDWGSVEPHWDAYVLVLRRCT